VRVRGLSGCVGFTPGYRFDLKGHYRRECNESYLITEIDHTLEEEIGDYSSGGGGSSTYENRFTCMPHRIPYRPLRTTPRPIIHGVQTATVVGRPGEEIHVDPHGRVKVQFHWDREGKRNQDSSCWIRVSQLWAGKSWGGMAIPRIGQEVVVEFIEGDPDRPLITGRVYNAEQKPPYDLPGAAHVMGMKSSSTPGGGGYNEISIDDTKGKEKMTIHAQYDSSTTVEHDETHTVHNNRTSTVDVNETAAVGVDQTLSVGSNQSLDVGANRSASVGANESLSVGGAQEESIGGARTLSIAGDDAIGVGGSRTLEVGSNLDALAGANISIGAGGKITLSAGGSTIEISAAGITISSAAPVEIQGATIKLN
jgi:type VI secretion system secreted protein VgrG